MQQSRLRPPPRADIFCFHQTSTMKAHLASFSANDMAACAGLVEGSPMYVTPNDSGKFGDACVPAEEVVEVVGDHRVDVDGSVEAAWTGRGRTHVPQSDATPLEAPQPFKVGQPWVRAHWATGRKPLERIQRC